MNSPHFGNRVKSRRSLLGLTQEDLGKAVGLSQVSIKKIESGGQTRHGRKIAVALRTTLQWLETGEDSNTDPEGNVDPSFASRELPKHREGELPDGPWPLKKATPNRFYALSAEERKVADAAIDMLLNGIEAARNK